MKLLLGTLVLGGVCWLGATVNIPSMPNFDNQRIAKNWYPLLAIPTGSAKSENFPPFRFVAQPGGSLLYSIRVPLNGECTAIEVMMNRQGQSGDFASNLPSSMRFVETDYETYFIAHISNAPGKTFLALAGSQPTLAPGMEAKLRAVARRYGITGETSHNVRQATC